MDLFFKGQPIHAVNAPLFTPHIILIKKQSTAIFYRYDMQ